MKAYVLIPPLVGVGAYLENAVVVGSYTDPFPFFAGTMGMLVAAGVVGVGFYVVHLLSRDTGDI